jgi:hypothetical protein
LFFIQLVEETFEGLCLAIFADKDNSAAEIIKYHGQIFMTFANGDLIHGKDA